MALLVLGFYYFIIIIKFVCVTGFGFYSQPSRQKVWPPISVIVVKQFYFILFAASLKSVRISNVWLLCDLVKVSKTRYTSV